MDRVCVETMESSHTGLVECLNNWQRMQLYVLPFCVTTANACSGISFDSRSSEVSFFSVGDGEMNTSEGSICKCHEIQFCLALCCIVESLRILSLFMHLHGSSSSV